MAEAQGAQPEYGESVVAAAQHQAAPESNVQAFARCEILGETDRRGGAVLNPPQKAVVLCLDEKSQIQALDRTHPGLPLKKGRCGTMTHDYKRNGTTTLFAALNPLDGKVIGECHPRHRHQEWLRFLRRLDQEFPRRAVALGHGQLRHS